MMMMTHLCLGRPISFLRIRQASDVVTTRRTASVQNLPGRTLRQKVWRFLEDPSSTPQARLWSTFMLLVILLSSTTFIIGSLTQFQEEINPTAVKTFNDIEYFCIACFTLEYLLRLVLAPSPRHINRVSPLDISRTPSMSTMRSEVTRVQSTDSNNTPFGVQTRFDPSQQPEHHNNHHLEPPPAPSNLPALPSPVPGYDMLGAPETMRLYILGRARFVSVGMNLVDVLAIMPFYIELLVNELVATSGSGDGGDSGAGALAIVRIVRIARIFRLLKLGKNQEGLSILSATMRASFSFLMSISFLLLIVEVIAASLIFFVESGDLCLIRYRCKGGSADRAACTRLVYPHDSEPPPVLAYRDSLGQAALGARTYDSPNSSFPDHSLCPGGSCEPYDNQCFLPDGTVSQFTSIPLALWFVTVTMCTVGYGDLAPSTDVGKVLGALTALMGLILLALPTTVLGMEFQKAYMDFQAKKRQLERKAKLEKARQAEERARMSRAVSITSAKGPELQQLMAGLDSANNMNFKQRQRFIIEIQLAADARKAGVSEDKILRTLGPIATKELAIRREKRYLNIISTSVQTDLSRQEFGVLGARALQEALAEVPTLMREESANLDASAEREGEVSEVSCLSTVVASGQSSSKTNTGPEQRSAAEEVQPQAVGPTPAEETPRPVESNAS